MHHEAKTRRRCEDVARAMTALSHPRRVAIFEALCDGPAEGVPFEALLGATALRRSSLAHHLRPMEVAGLVIRRRKGVAVTFALQGAAVRAVAEGVSQRLIRKPAAR